MFVILSTPSATAGHVVNMVMPARWNCSRTLKPGERIVVPDGASQRALAMLAIDYRELQGRLKRIARAVIGAGHCPGRLKSLLLGDPTLKNNRRLKALPIRDETACAPIVQWAGRQFANWQQALCDNVDTERAIVERAVRDAIPRHVPGDDGRESASRDQDHAAAPSTVVHLPPSAHTPAAPDQRAKDLAGHCQPAHAGEEVPCRN